MRHEYVKLRLYLHTAMTLLFGKSKMAFMLATTSLTARFIPTSAPFVTGHRITHPLPLLTQRFRRTFASCTTNPATTSSATAAPSNSTSSDSSTSSSTQPQSKQTVLDVLRERGLVDAATADDDVLRPLLSSPVGVYTGFDPTADSLHLGNLLAIIAMAWFQRMGHRVYALVGGATGKVGDPSGKSQERPVLDDATIANNLKGIEANIRQVLNRSAEQCSNPGELMVLNNHDWVGPITFLDFLRDVGKHARVNTMMSKDSVKTRLNSEEGMSFTEFTYQLLQAYDFMHLSDTHDVTFQLGGSDQWGNITAGTELARKIRNGRTLHGITFPLLTTSDGRKFGKSEKGAVWLTASKLSPYEMYQFLYKTPDADVITFLKRLTFLPLDQIDSIQHQMSSPEYKPNTAQKLLAQEVTRIVHGDEGVEAALAATAAAAPGSKAVLSADALEAIAKDMPSAVMTRDETVGRTIIDVMVQGGLQKSKGEARRLVKNGGAYMNNQKISNFSLTVSEEDLIDGRLLLLAAGKKNKLVVRVE